MQDMDRFIDVVQSLVAIYGLKVIAAIVIFFIGKWISGMLSRAVGSAMRRAKTDEYFQITEAVKQRFDAAGISIPFPQRDVHLIQSEAA